MFADNTAAYNKVTSPEDQTHLQQDLNQLAEWEKRWDMSFHPGKCSNLPVTRSRNPLRYDYCLHGHTLETVTSAKNTWASPSPVTSPRTRTSTICAAKPTRSWVFVTKLQGQLPEDQGNRLQVLRATCPGILQQRLGSSHRAEHRQAGSGATQGSPLHHEALPQHL